MDSFLVCKDLCKNFLARPVIRGLSFDLKAGEGLVVRGANGAGKTTLLAILAGLLERESGEILLKGKNLNTREHRLRAGIGFSQAGETGLFLNATVEENFRFWAKLHGMGAKTSMRIDEVAEQWDLQSVLKKAARELSSGFKKRVAIARAILPDPELLLLDEPFAFLDQEHIRIAAEHLENWLARKRGAIVLSTHLEFQRNEKWKSIEIQAI